MTRTVPIAAVLLFALPTLADDIKPFPMPLADGKQPAADGWFGKQVLPKRHSSEIRMGGWKAGQPEAWVPHNLLDAVVREERDGFLRVYDGCREGWVSKADMVPAEDAPAHFNAAVRERPNDAYAWHMRALGWLKKGEYDNAVKDFTEVIRLRPDAAAYTSLGNARKAKGDNDAAIQEYDEAIRLDPRCALAFHNRGSVRRLKKEYDAAVADFTEAIRLDPADGKPFGGRGGVWADKREYARAIADYAEAYRLDQTDTHSLNELVYWLAVCPTDHLRDGTKAVKLGEKLVGLDGWNWNHHDTLAMAYAEAGRFDAAVAQQQEAVRTLEGIKTADAEVLKRAKVRLALYQAKQPPRNQPAK